MKWGIFTLVKFSDRIFSLLRILHLCVFLVRRVGLYVVPGVEFENVVIFEEVSRTELEGIAAFKIIAGVVRAVRRDNHRLCGYSGLL